MSGHIRDPSELVRLLGQMIIAGPFQFKYTILSCSILTHCLVSISIWPQLHREDCKAQDTHTVIPKLEIFAQPQQTLAQYLLPYSYCPGMSGFWLQEREI